MLCRNPSPPKHLSSSQPYRHFPCEVFRRKAAAWFQGRETARRHHLREISRSRGFLDEAIVCVEHRKNPTYRHRPRTRRNEKKNEKKREKNETPTETRLAHWPGSKPALEQPLHMSQSHPKDRLQESLSGANPDAANQRRRTRVCRRGAIGTGSAGPSTSYKR